ncbi:hypothetical protein B0H14DRAFT_529495 [Mycena olivaceomarginata]|nr:hypothetical protein B0H14DRAFT_529495 [Mycena olivaceomarginata]
MLIFTTMAVFDSCLLPDATKAHIRELSRTYGAPPDHLLSIISTLSDELERCDAEIAPLKAQLAEIETNRAVIDELRRECRGLLSPLRRLPSEILVNIFELCMRTCPSITDPEYVSLDIEMARLAHEPLLKISRVCSRWHAVVMGAASLWTVLELDPILWDSRSDVDRVMQLLRLSLGRGGNSLLDISIHGRIHLPAFQLLATHSARWKKMEIWGPRDQIPAMISAMVSFPGITLGQYLGRPSHRSSDDRPFTTAPRLRTFEIAGNLLGIISHPPLDQLCAFKCQDFMPTDFINCLSRMSRCLQTTAFCLRINFDNWPEVHSGALHLLQNAPPTVSEIGCFSIEMLDTYPESHQVIGEIFAALTLPQLHELALTAATPWTIPLVWPRVEFLALSARSSFPTHLHVLELRNVVLTEPELIECLSTLPSLEQLAIADHTAGKSDVSSVSSDEDPVETLITDTLLAALTHPRPFNPAPLVPRLCTFKCHSRLQFDDNVLLAFLLSRLQTGSFRCEMYFLLGYSRELDLRVIAQIDEQRIQKKLMFTFDACE